MDEMPSGGSAGTEPREERRKTIRTKQNARFQGPSGLWDGAIREGRSAFGQFDRNGAKGGTSQDDPNGANRETWRRLRTARA
jgi:hypothetical protein